MSNFPTKTITYFQIIIYLSNLNLWSFPGFSTKPIQINNVSNLNFQFIALKMYGQCHELGIQGA